MGFDNETYELLKRYQSDQLSPAEQAAVEARRQNDPEFAEALRSYDRLHQTIQHYGDQQLDTRLSELGASLLQQNPREIRPIRTPNRRMIWLAAAAAAVLVLAVLSVVFWPRTQLAPEALFAAHFAPKSAPGERGSTESDLWPRALDHYAAREYATAIGNFDRLLADSSFQFPDQALLYQGISYLALDQTQAAIERLEQVSPEKYEHDDAQWFLALAWLKTGEAQKARHTFQFIAQQKSHPYQAQAQQLLAHW